MGLKPPRYHEGYRVDRGTRMKAHLVEGVAVSSWTRPRGACFDGVMVFGEALVERLLLVGSYVPDASLDPRGGCGIGYSSPSTVYYRRPLRRCGRATPKENTGDSVVIRGRIDPGRAAIEGGFIMAPS